MPSNTFAGYEQPDAGICACLAQRAYGVLFETIKYAANEDCRIKDYWSLDSGGEGAAEWTECSTANCVIQNQRGYDITINGLKLDKYAFFMVLRSTSGATEAIKLYVHFQDFPKTSCRKHQQLSYLTGKFDE
ncbi:hypothetical protein E4U43_003569 [Claviceps pusilla]|uniref:Uncharacterized protein n=1 Tax=Claviceps pusilla TaxID=123648 RepID=A0A9P7NHV5_9HYPO|nr:hypothetical protein E4U43_003569 [Claviceps pusilla]